MRTLLNIIWLLFGGIWLWLGYLLVGVIACAFIVTIPAGLACFRIAQYVLWPFGRSVVPLPHAGAVGSDERCLVPDRWTLACNWARSNSCCASRDDRRYSGGARESEDDSGDLLPVRKDRGF